MSSTEQHGSDSAQPERGPSQFTTTQWSVVLAVANSDATSSSREALETLCRNYWHPVYGFVRRTVSNLEDARDLTQGFFAHLLQSKSLRRADPERGRFRSFLLGAVKHFLADEHDRRTALKRGGNIEFLRFDTLMAETRSAPMPNTSAESQFDRTWALSVLDSALRRLREEFELSGRAALFDSFKAFLTGETANETYAEVANRLRITPGAAKMTVSRMRDRFRAIVRQEISQTVSTPDQLESELRTFVETLTSL